MLASDPSQAPTDPPAASTAVAGRTLKKLSVLLPAELHQRARRHALLHDKTLTTLIIELLASVVDDAGPQASDSREPAAAAASPPE